MFEGFRLIPKGTHHKLGTVGGHVTESSSFQCIAQSTQVLAHPGVGQRVRTIATFMILVCCLTKISMAQNNPEVDEVEKQIQELIQVYESKYPGNQPEKIPAFTKAAEIYRQVGMPQKAIPLYSKILIIQEAIEKQPSIERVNTLSNLSLVYAVVGRFDEAVIAATKLIEILKRYYHDDSAAIYSAMNNLASCYLGMKHYTEAEKTYLDILKLSETLMKANKKSIAATYNNLGGLYYQTKQFPKAEKMFEAALSIKKQIFAESQTEEARKDVGFTVFNLSQFYAHLGQNEKATKMEAEATKTWGFSPPK